MNSRENTDAGHPPRNGTNRAATHDGPFPGSRIGGTALRNLDATPLIGGIRSDLGNLCDNSFVPARAPAARR